MKPEVARAEAFVRLYSPDKVLWFKYSVSIPMAENAEEVHVSQGRMEAEDLAQLIWNIGDFIVYIRIAERREDL